MVKFNLRCLFLVATICALTSGRLLVSSPENFETKDIHQMGAPETIINNMTHAETLTATHVHGLQTNSTQIHAGYVQLTNSTDEFIHFTYYPATNKTVSTANTVVWLQGGPGCSSAIGNFFEIGPHQVVRDSENNAILAAREHHWSINNNLVFIDNPVGSGYSFTQDSSHYVTNQHQMARDLHQVLSTFLRKFDLIHNPLYITGESYAGKYIPSIAQYILRANAGHTLRSEVFSEEAVIQDSEDFEFEWKTAQDIESGNLPHLPLRGIIVIDGWTAPFEMAGHFADYSVATGLIDLNEVARIEHYQKQVQQAISVKHWHVAHSKMGTLWNSISFKAGGCDIYNDRHYYGNDMSGVTEFLNQDSTKEAFHVPSDLTWQECNSPSYTALYSDFMKSVKSKFPYILNHIPVLLWNGQDDLIVNHLSAQKWIETIQWSQINEFNAAHRSLKRTTSDHLPYVYEKSHGNLHWKLLLKAGHMGPHDQPRFAQCILEEFVGNETPEFC